MPEHEHLVRLADRIAEPISVGDAIAIGIDRHVPPHTILVIQDVRPQPWLRGEHAVEHGMHRVTRHGLHRATQVPFQIGRECDARHSDCCCSHRRLDHHPDTPNRSATMPKLARRRSWSAASAPARHRPAHRTAASPRHRRSRRATAKSPGSSACPVQRPSEAITVVPPICEARMHHLVLGAGRDHALGARLGAVLASHHHLTSAPSVLR